MEILTKRPEEMSIEAYKAHMKFQAKYLKRRTSKPMPFISSKEHVPFVGKVKEQKNFRNVPR